MRAARPAAGAPPRYESAVRAKRGGLTDRHARRLADYIGAHLDCCILASDLAEQVGLSASHLFRAFKATFGVTPRAYVSQRRVERAQQLLSSSPMPLSQIALECGMYDQPHFTRLFKSVVGLNPGAWRRRSAAVDRAFVQW